MKLGNHSVSPYLSFTLRKKDTGYALGLMALLGLYPGSALADLDLSAIFGDNMALQAEAPIQFWGQSDPGSEVTVTFEKAEGGSLASAATKANDAGEWALALDPLPMATRGRVTVHNSAGDSRTFPNVITADVWLASGQSNMEWSLRRADGGPEAAAQADYPDIRLFKVERNASPDPTGEIVTKAGWVVCQPDNADQYSAVGFYFARELNQTLQRPVGLICSYWGGTRAESWTPEATLASLTKSEPEPEQLRTAAPNVDENTADARPAKPKTHNPKESKPQSTPGSLYNGMIHPLIPYTLEGVIWYQGEANRADYVSYRTLFPAMIQSWREEWGQGSFPFVYVELANFKAPQQQPIEGDWAWIRDAQRRALEIPDVYVATAFDVGDADDIHPGDKETVGRRLALTVLENFYDDPRGASSAQVAEIRREGNRFVVKVDNAYDGLVVKEPGKRLPFAIKDQDGNSHWATAEIAGDTITIWNDAIETPAEAYYAWASNPYVGVYNSKGLPLLAFSSETFPRSPTRTDRNTPD